MENVILKFQIHTVNFLLDFTNGIIKIILLDFSCLFFVRRSFISLMIIKHSVVTDSCYVADS